LRHGAGRLGLKAPQLQEEVLDCCVVCVWQVDVTVMEFTMRQRKYALRRDVVVIVQGRLEGEERNRDWHSDC
jgi:hypothetical protein